MARLLLAPNTQLPWSSSRQEDKKFWRIFLILLIPTVIIGAGIPIINLPEKNREDLEKLPPQLARIVIEKKEVPPPPPPPKKEKPKKEEPKKEEKKPEEKKKPEPKKEEPKKPEPKAKLIEQAREVAQAEVNQFADALADMRDSFDFDDVEPQQLTRAGGEAVKQDRSIINSGAKVASGGVNNAKLSRDVGGNALSGKTTTKVDSQLASTSGTAAKAKKKARAGGYRGNEEIRKVLERNKTKLFNIYNRALRKNPALEGKFEFELVIEPNGKVSSVKILSSELQDPDLERKLLARIRLINFGPSSSLATKLIYAIDFFPQ